MSGELTGLTSAEVRDRIERDLVNRLPSRSGRSTADIVRANVFTRVNLILFVLFCCVLITGHLLQGAFGLLIIANSVIGIVQELRAKRTLDNLAVVGEAHPTVIRDGHVHQIVRDAVVLDDLIAIHPGDQIVVDGSMVAADYLEVDESLLTGEADPVTKAPGDGVLSGSYVLSGTGVYRAEKVGSDAYAAQLTAQAAKFTLVSSELRQGIDRILRVVGYLLIPVGLLNIYVQFSQPDTDWRTSVLRATAALVPMVPEGLVLLTSMAFALGVIRLGRRNCLVQELPAIEGLARVSVVCADKTGTLTQHAMTLGTVVPLGVPRGRIDEVLSQLVAADPAPNASMRAIGDHIPAPVDPWEVRARAPFTSAKKWSGVTFAREGSWLIGAADILADADVAAEVFESRVSVLSSCSEVPSYIVNAQSVSGLAEDTFQITVDDGAGALLLNQTVTVDITDVFETHIHNDYVTGGLELALYCDILIASENAKFADTHARVGLLPTWGLSVRLPQKAGVGLARRMSLTGDYLSAAEALRAGLVTEVVPHDELLRAVWGPGYSREHHYLRVFANQIRRKIEPDPSRPTVIRTIRGGGYVFSPAGDKA